MPGPRKRTFATIFEHALDGIILTDDARRVVDANPAACRLLRRTRRELLTLPAAELVPPADAALASEATSVFVPTGSTEGEARMAMPDGSVRRVEYSSVNNAFRGLHLTIFRDIEDRKRAEEAMQFLDVASQVLTSSLDYDQTLAAVARLAVPRISDWATVHLLEPDGSLRCLAAAHVDPKKEELARAVRWRRRRRADDVSGASTAARTGRPVLKETVTDEQLATVMGHDPELLATVRQLGLVSAMHVPLHARGRVFGVLALHSAESCRKFGQADLVVANEIARRASYAIENALVVRELREANAAKECFLRRTEHLQSTATLLVRARTVEEIGRIFVSAGNPPPAGARGGVLYISTATELRLLAITPGLTDASRGWEAVPLSMESPLTDACRARKPVWLIDRREWAAKYPAIGARLSEASAVATIPLVAGDALMGLYGVSFRERHEFSEDERAFLAAVADLWAQAIHRARLAEAERDAMQRALEAEANAARKKDEFLAVLSHELRNPLAPIMAATSLIRARGAASPRELAVLERQSHHMVRLVDDLLDVARITSGKLSLARRPVDTAEIVAQAVENVAPYFEEKQVRLVRAAAPPGLLVDGDRERLVQVVTNLLMNACKFTPSDKTVYLSTRAERADGVIEVSDEGQGISPQLLPHIFDAFTQGQQASDKRHGGLGLGLAIVRSIVAAHGGTIAANSPGPGRGATFVVRLRRVMDVRASAPGAVGATLAAAPARRRVLVVDDNVDSADMVAALLGAVGYDPVVANDSPRALSLVRQNPPDAAILDIGLPEMDGYGLARTISEELGARAPKLIAMTGYTQHNDRARAVAAGFSEYLAKPVDLTKLAATLHRMLAVT
jgi:PAS domain S-box-containing protein